MNFIRRLFEKLAGPKRATNFGDDRDHLYKVVNRLYEVEVYDYYGKITVSVEVEADSDIAAQEDALHVFGGEYAIAELVD